MGLELRALSHLDSLKVLVLDRRTAASSSPCASATAATAARPDPDREQPRELPRRPAHAALQQEVHGASVAVTTL